MITSTYFCLENTMPKELKTTKHDVLTMTFSERTLPSDRMYRDLEATGAALQARIPQASPHYLLLTYMLHYAQMLRADAAYSGSMSDRDSKQLESEIEVFIAGVIERTTPTSWKKYAAMLAKNTDPEYAVYLRLQKKFGK